MYKNAPYILRFLWRLMRIVWQEKTIPKVWHRAGGVLIPKDKDSENISQFRLMSLLNVEVKVFFRVIAKRLPGYLKRNSYLDTAGQKAGTVKSGFSGCLKYSSMIWQQILMAKVGKKHLHVVFLDLANAFGSVPYSLLWTAFNFFYIPDSITTLMKSYFIIRASRWALGGQRLNSDFRLSPLKAYMDNITTLTTMVPCTRRLLRKLEKNIS